jgi:hypothetical protein
MCIDDFYENPDEVRNFALSLDYEKDEFGYWPGKRTKPLHEIDEEFFRHFCTRLFSVYYDFSFVQFEYNLLTHFQLIEPFSCEKSSAKNQGWIHLDSGFILGGVIYLNPEIDASCGTSLYRVTNSELIDTWRPTKEIFYKNGIDQNYDEEILKHNSAFEETVRFNNVYNRLISFDAQVYHGANNFHTNKEPRLTQVFFVNSIKSNSKTPLQR